jgi:hypothetical protein
MIEKNAHGSAISAQLSASLQDLSTRCAEINVPVLVAFQASDDACTALILGEKGQDSMLKLAMTLLKGDVDEFLRGLISHAKENGHNSIFLKAMGVPNKPEHR